ncbi:TonB-linked outer membrane protein, SusC/RagA family [Wenyingzhuangia marina]|uniref:TonB-linked outer membrane protein, SusC/RagA family n=2 Tax=Wenyingzhuangia marina TaxID=1195760 RepID=A0A1M5S0U7_9FLAO|nr:SusC/RagA family TonB-linked outer membrane protein [Wenyingzhuangia marina]SHH31948.1 TonB-linked outer membrane protein, SusC/RagA family [Wenyingzhuangia marina]
MSYKLTIMLKIFKLTSLACALFFGGINTNLYAQVDNNTVNSETKNGTLIKGLVKDAATGNGLAGISISVENFSSAISNEDGTFTIKVPNLNSLLSVKGEGYQAKVYPVNSRNEGLEISLYEENYSQNFQEANTPGKKVLQYENIQSATVVDFEKDQWGITTNQSVENFIQGRVAGLNSVGNSGVPGAGSYLTIRGFNSLYATNKPLIIIDGMIYEDDDYGSGIIQNNTSSPLTMLDVKDIEDVTVIKDGSSLYGTKGANGVILITTTRATESTTKIDFAIQGGVNQAPSILPVMDSNAYRTYMSQLVATRGDSQQQISQLPWMNDDPQSLSYYRYHNNTNWQDQVFKSTENTSYFLKIKGGDNIAKYGLSVGYLKNQGITQGTDLSRYNTRLNADLRLTEKLSILSNISFAYNEETQNHQGQAYKLSPMYLALTKSPLIGIYEYDENGKESPNLTDTDIFDSGNPNAINKYGYAFNKNYRFYGNLDAKYKISNSLTANILLGMTYSKEREKFFVPNFGTANVILPTAIGTNRSGSEVQEYKSSYTDIYLNFKETLGGVNNIHLRAGFRSQINKSENDLGLGYNSATDDFTTIGAGDNSLRVIGGGIGEWNWYNLYGVFNYNIANKYYFTLNSSIDKSSRFGNNTNSSLLGTIGAGWLISSENFMKDMSTINLLKIRSSYGLSGNDDIGNYTSQELYVSQNLLGVQGLVLSNIGNPDLKWEQVRKFNVGLDMSLFNERVNASLDFYENKTTDMITYQSTNTITGLDYIVANGGSMKTNGYELSLNTRLIQSKDIKFDVGLNLARYKNKVLSLPGDNILNEFGGATYITAEGQDANLFYGLKANGVYSSTSEASGAGLSRRTADGTLIPFGGGDVIFEDLNGDKIIDDKDRRVIGNPNPDLTGSVSANFTYKRITVSGLLNFSLGNDIYNSVRNNLEKMSGYENQSLAVQNRWMAEGQETSIPKATWGDPLGNSEFSSRWIEDGSYLRLKTVMVSYDFNVKSSLLRYLKLYASANNLFTITDYLGFDPEFSATSSIYGQGTDVGLMPQFRTVQLGLRIGL